MAKKKDITRNPPSWLEKGLFIFIIVIMIAVAFPMFWRLNKDTREFYACYEKQKILLECLSEWKEETGAGKYDKISEDEILRRYTEKTGETELPRCPHPGGETDALYQKRSGTISCGYHKYVEKVIEKDDK